MPASSRVRQSVAALLVTASVSASLPLPVALAQVPITEDARRHFKAGVNLLNDPDGARYEEAYREFKVAYADSPSYKILGNLGLCAMKLERDGEAIDAYDKYLNEAKDMAQAERNQISTDLTTLRTSAATVTVVSDSPEATVVDTRVPVNGNTITNDYPLTGGKLEIRVRPGHHRILVKVTGKQSEIWEIDAAPGASEMHDFKLVAGAEGGGGAGNGAGSGGDTGATQADRPIPPTVYAGIAVTGAFVIGTAITGVLATSKRSDFNKANGVNPKSAQNLRDQGQQLNLITDVLLGGAVIAAGVTVVLYVTRGPGGDPAKTEKPATGWTLVPSVGPRVAGVSLTGHF